MGPGVGSAQIGTGVGSAQIGERGRDARKWAMWVNDKGETREWTLVPRRVPLFHPSMTRNSHLGWIPPPVRAEPVEALRHVDPMPVRTELVEGPDHIATRPARATSLLAATYV